MASNTLTGTTGNDILNAPGSVDTEVLGLEGNDTLSLIKSGDIGKAGKGDDSILVNVDGSAKSSVYGGQGSDTITLGTAVLTNQTYLQGLAGNDSISFAGGAGFTVNNGAFVSGNAGDDSITVSAAATLVTAGGGQGSDVITFQAGGTSSDVQGGKGKDSITLVGTFTGSTIGGSNGFDTIRATGFTGTTSLLGGGKGGDSIAVGTGAIATLVGGYLNDTITAFGAFGGGVVYGDKNGETVAGTGTGAEADGADLFSFTAAAIAASSSIYGAGGADTIKLQDTANAKLVVDGGKGADLVGSTSLVIDDVSTLAGGNGHDTVKFLSLLSANILGGAGNDSISGAVASGIAVSINGGAGADSITFLANSFQSAQDMATINGGAGADVITLGSYTAATGTIDSGNVLGNVVYESGDKIIVNGTNAVAAAANWLGDTQIEVASARTEASAFVSMSQAGSLLVFTEGDDLIIGITRTAGATTASLINVIGGAGAVKTTATGTITRNTDNFAFTVGTSNNDLVITFT